jgi:YVTN family beta-propeller protein
MRKILMSTVVGMSLAAGGMAVAKGMAASFKTAKVPLAGEGRGDYLLVDGPSNRLFVSHTGTVHILNLTTLKQTGLVTGLTKSAGVALAAGKGFASDGGGNQVVVFDPATGNTVKTLKDGNKPDSILFDQPSGMIMVFNGGSNSVTVIDPVKAEVVKTIALSDAPEAARNDGAGKAYVNLGEEHAVGVIDTAKGEVVGKYVMADCEGPAALGIDTVHHRVFSTCENHVMKVLDAGTGRIVATLPVGEDPDGIIYDGAHRRVFVGARDGTWSIFDQLTPDRYRLNQVYRIDKYAKTLALDPKTNRIFSSTADLVWPEKVPGVRWLPNAKSGTFRLMVVSPK